MMKALTYLTGKATRAEVALLYTSVLLALALAVAAVLAHQCLQWKRAWHDVHTNTIVISP